MTDEDLANVFKNIHTIILLLFILNSNKYESILCHVSVFFMYKIIYRYYKHFSKKSMTQIIALIEFNK
jgi:hypothetical protein